MTDVGMTRFASSMDVHHRKIVMILLCLAAVTLLSLWRAHSRLSRTLPVIIRGGYDKSLLEVRHYNSEDGRFQVVFSRVRDVMKTNAVLAPRANQTNHLEKSSINIQLKEVGEMHLPQDINPKMNHDSPYRLRQLAYSTEQKRVLETKQGKKSTSGNVISPFLHSLPEDKRLDALAQSDGLPVWTPGGNLTKQVVGDHQYKSLSMEQHREQWQVGMPRPPPPPLLPQPALQEQKIYVNRIQSPHLVGNDNLKVLEPSSSDLKQVLSMKHVENVDLTFTPQQLSKPTQFSVKNYMSWPLPLHTRADILQSQWVKDLKQYLSGIGNFNQISIVTANQEHMEVVLNWLVSAIIVAKLPLENVLVLSVSLKLHELLVSKKINSIYVPSTHVISKSGLKQIRTAFNQIHIVRLTFFRLINHWGYDVVMYDSDAALLKNPQPLFDAYPGVELVGSAGRGPENIGRVWGRTICTGVLLMRSSKSSGKCMTTPRVYVVLVLHMWI